MVGGSGLRSALADSARSSTHAFPSALALLTTLTTLGCVYFNSLYNANRLFDQGAREIEEGRESTGRATLASGIEKAERLIARSPDSHWADDALRLIVRARLLREEWEEARGAGRKLLGYAGSPRDSAEVAGYLGVAAFNLGEAATADSLLFTALSGLSDGRRRSELLLYRGRARRELGRVAAADEDLRSASELRPTWAPPRIDRFELLGANGRAQLATRELGVLYSLRLRDTEQRAVIAAAQAVARQSPEAALAALVGVESSRFSRATRQQLVKLRGDLRISRGEIQQGRRDYELTATIDRESSVAVVAQLALLKPELERAASVEDFQRVRARLEGLAAGSAARRDAEVNRLRDAFVRMDFWVSLGGLGYLLAAETARDKLAAPRLARHLFLRYAEAQPEALWAPKAILAALDLTLLDSGGSYPDARLGAEREELRERLLTDYRDSPYVQVLMGETGGRFSFEELERGLRRQLERLQTLADREVQARRSTSTGS